MITNAREKLIKNIIEKKINTLNVAHYEKNTVVKKKNGGGKLANITNGQYKNQRSQNLPRKQIKWTEM